MAGIWVRLLSNFVACSDRNAQRYRTRIRASVSQSLLYRIDQHIDYAAKILAIMLLYRFLLPLRIYMFESFCLLETNKHLLLPFGAQGRQSVVKRPLYPPTKHSLF
jgi:hypothetical protein